DHISPVPPREKSGTAAKDFCRDAMYCRTATARIRTEVAIQMTAQKRAGIPVALAMFTASVGTVAAKGDERKSTVFKSSKAFRTHWTASKLTRNVATRADANLATANRPADSSTPANSVNGRPLNVAHVPEKIGFTTPNVTVNPSTTAAEPNSTTRAATDLRIRTSSSAP